ncbi:aldehyde dehydrogenase [Actinorhabdospora filicis]|uniref:Aldehyde dehydrogenase n=1 Tax=Actinorhabdospora filicis TaxID=1785913 RepID=A0A9W6WBV7_9ACTN|nr:aldehyde dehydrogenase (NADP(+)) [Actinorhabdospora filicis]GLZ81019.1 aldehyde dehydrogenase [Actinorhabdospora filicis]
MTEALRSIDPRTGEATGEPVPVTSPADVDRAATRAAAAAPAFAALPLATRAALLRGISATLGAHADEIVATADAETALGTARLTGELGRTRVQFELFADAVEAGAFLEIIIDKADLDAKPTPRPDLRRMLVPLGPVAVYAASNFPLAFSVPGGDTASALAAGCPVVVKAHEAHPRTSLLCARLITEALAEGGAPDGVFSVVYGFEAGTALVRHPAIKAAGFTGSLHGGRALHDLAASRPEPIPFFGELGSVNPVVVTPAALAERGPAIAEGYVASMTLGAGQFCTKPGVLFLPEGHGLDDALAAAAAATTPHPLLHERIRDGYLAGVEALAALPGVRVLAAPGKGENGFSVRTGLFGVEEKYFRANTEVLLTECFGPASVVVEYAPESAADLPSLIPGSLTATVHIGTDEDAAALVAGLARRVGRIIVNGWPTGVAVTAAQQHGGPWPAATTSQHTSVGETAMRRWLRPVSYQDTPQALLPEVLKDTAEGTLPCRVSQSFGS